MNGTTQGLSNTKVNSKANFCFASVLKDIFAILDCFDKRRGKNKNSRETKMHKWRQNYLQMADCQ